MTTRLEALDHVIKFQQASEAGSIVEMFKAVGITDEIAELMNIEDLADAMAVRLADYMNIAKGNKPANDY